MFSNCSWNFYQFAFWELNPNEWYHHLYLEIEFWRFSNDVKHLSNFKKNLFSFFFLKRGKIIEPLQQKQICWLLNCPVTVVLRSIFLNCCCCCCCCCFNSRLDERKILASNNKVVVSATSKCNCMTTTSTTTAAKKVWRNTRTCNFTSNVWNKFNKADY